MKTIYKKLLFLLLLLPFCAIAQNKIEGTVLDNVSGQPIPGVNVKIEGSATSASTDFDGKFQLNDVKPTDKLNISYMGYQTKSITVGNQKSLTIKLDEDSNQLKEVVVQVGYGAIKKKDATGAVAVLSSKDFNKGAVISADQLIAGKVSGVVVTSSGGSPDSTTNIRIRGGSSLSASNNPLIIIDGVALDNITPAGSANPMSLVNPNDIETFSILKDASATAIYGSRASNGVILITTKKGTSGEPQFSYTNITSIGYINKNIDMMDGTSFSKFIQSNFPAQTNLLGIDDPTTTAVDNLATSQIEGRILSNTDWQKVIYRNAVSSDHNFSAKANLFKKIPFRASVGYLDYEGLVKTNDYKRYSGALKLSPSLLEDHLKIDVNAKVLRSEKNAVDEGGAIGSALNMDPTKPVYDNGTNPIFGGYYQNLNPTTQNIAGQINPLNILEQRRRPEEINKFLGNAQFDYKLHFLPSVKAVVNLGLEASNSHIEEVYGDYAIQTYGLNQTTNTNILNPGVNYIEDQTITNKTLNSYFVYTLPSTNGFVSKFDVQAGYDYQNFVVDGNKSIFRYNPTTHIREPFIENVNNTNNRYYNSYNIQSFFGRSNVDLLNKYLFTFTVRADGSSLFKADNRWGIFPAVGFAWRIKDESFLKDVETLGDLKLRLGYGITGQQDIISVAGYYPTSPLFAPGTVTSQYLPGINTYSALPFDDSLTWEKTTTVNVGIDFELFKNGLLSGTVDVYAKKTNDLLAKVPGKPGQSLTNEFVANVGSLTNNGVEVSLNLKPIATDNLTWIINGNAAYNESEITDLKGVTANPVADSKLPTGTGIAFAYNAVGQAPFSAWVFEQVYDASGKPIQGAYVDRNKDGIITNDDKYYEPLRPKFSFGFGTTLTYKNVDFSANFRGQSGGKTYNSRNLVAGNVARAFDTQANTLNNVLDMDLPFQNTLNGVESSDYFLEDASFVRCENITLGYKFKEIVKGLNLRVYTAANNLFIITKYSGQDPENFNGIDNNFYPRPTMYSLGVNLDF